MSNKYIEILLPFLKKAGKLAVSKQNEITGCSKVDGSIVTETDVKISDMFQKLIKKNFKDHHILDEEKALQDKKLREMSEEYQISPSRISRIIQSGLNRIKKELVKQEML